MPEGAGLSWSNVCKVYEGAQGATQALDGFTLDVGPGESVAVLGPSGCGKSTALRIASGLAAPTSGSVAVNGRPIASPRRATALILQDFGQHALPWRGR